MNEHYRFMVNGVQMNPIYKQDTGIDYELEQSQVFFRKKLSSNLTFIGNDYLFINGQPFETKFTLILERWVDGAWKTELVGEFYKTDGKWDDVNQKVDITVDTIDDYKDVLAGMDKEFNLIELAPKTESISVARRPVIQIYREDDKVVSCFGGGTYWEQEAANPSGSDSAIVNTFKFSKIARPAEIELKGIGTPNDAIGFYSGLAVDDPTFLNETGLYKMTFEDVVPQPGETTIDVMLSISKVSDGLILWQSNRFAPQDFISRDYAMNPRADNGASGTLMASVYIYDLYARLICDVDSINGTPTYPIPADDLVGNNRNYTRIVGFGTESIIASTKTSPEPTKYGKNKGGEYFAELMPPMSTSIGRAFPIARSSWSWMSLWFFYPTFYLDLFEPKAIHYFELKDNYTIGSAIKAILKKIAPNIQHEETEEYSKFLYADVNPITNKAMDVLINQKTNLIVGKYDLPAQKAQIMLADIFGMLKNAFKCYWHIENGKLKIEHIKYYMNGGSYDLSPAVGIDLTTMINKKANKPWSFALNKYDYDKFDLPERYEFNWMDDVSEAFEGIPINMKSNYVNVGKKEEINVSKFTTDVDFVMINPDSISKEGFMLFAAAKGSNTIISQNNGWYSVNNVFTFSLDFYYQKMAVSSGYFYSVSGTVNPGKPLAIVLDANGSVIFKIDPPAAQKQYINELILIPDGGVTLIVNSYAFDIKPIVSAYKLPMVSGSFKNQDVKLQNGYASWIYIHPKFYPYDLPARLVEINGEETTATGVLRKKKQNVSFPWGGDIDTNKLIRTGLGDGKIDKISVSLSDRFVTATLKYEVDK